MKNIHWIQGDTVCESPLFRRSFTVPALKAARLEICGLGFFHLYVNGRRVGDEEFVPAVSNYTSVLGFVVFLPLQQNYIYFS